MGRAMRWGTNSRLGLGLLQSKKGFVEWQYRSGGLRGDRVEYMVENGAD